jgi:transcriptional repressor NrdR
MKCPYCSQPESKVVDSRDSETGEAVRRRRECLSCHKRFTTYERVEAVPLWVVKKDGRREEFNRRKLIGGLVNASTKRDIASAQLEAIADEVESALRARNVTEVRSIEVGEMVMQHLRTLDEIAYVRFASVYRSFRDVQQMRATIEDVLANPPGTRPPEAPRRRRRRADDGRELPLDMGK